MNENCLFGKPRPVGGELHIEKLRKINMADEFHKISPGVTQTTEEPPCSSQLIPQ
jgi:hypothetical protein